MPEDKEIFPILEGCWRELQRLFLFLPWRQPYIGDAFLKTLPPAKRHGYNDFEAVPNRNSPPAVLLRETYRQGGKIKKRTLLNLTS